MKKFVRVCFWPIIWVAIACGTSAILVNEVTKVIALRIAEKVAEKAMETKSQKDWRIYWRSIAMPTTAWQVGQSDSEEEAKLLFLRCIETREVDTTCELVECEEHCEVKMKYDIDTQTWLRLHPPAKQEENKCCCRPCLTEIPYAEAPDSGEGWQIQPVQRD
jgi:hypothetical protein